MPNLSEHGGLILLSDIAHGTDTMINTAKVLKNISDKTIVMTGSMYPAQFRDSDAVFNIGCAVTAAQILGPGVYIAMNGRIFKPHQVRKNVELNRFEEVIVKQQEENG
jgi:L-asparaginase